MKILCQREWVVLHRPTEIKQRAQFAALTAFAVSDARRGEVFSEDKVQISFNFLWRGSERRPGAPFRNLCYKEGL